jgi:hypothetical protein
MASSGYTAEQISAGLGVHSYEGGGTFDPTAQNPNSGAVGISQDLGPRQTGLSAFLNSTGQTPSVASETDYDLSELRGPEAAADKAVRSASTVEDAARAWSHSFERPGAAGEAKEVPYAIDLGNRALPLVRARLAAAAGAAGGSTPSGSEANPAFIGAMTQQADPDRAAIDEALRMRARALGQPDPTLPGPPRVENVQLPSGETSPQPDPIGEALKLRAASRAAAGAAALKAAAGAEGSAAGGSGFPSNPLPDAGILHELAHDGKLLPGAVARGLTDLLGTPADAVSSLANYYAANPAQAAIAASGGMALSAPDLPAQPGATSPISALVAPATSRSITAAGNRAGAALGMGSGVLNSPAENGDYDVAHNAVFGLGRFVGAGVDPFNPLGLVGVGRGAYGVLRGVEGAGAALGKAALSAAGTHVLAPVAIAGGADAGEYATGVLGGQAAEQRFGNLVGIPLGIAFRGAGEGLLLKGLAGGKAGFAGVGKALGNGRPVFDNPSEALSNLGDGAFAASLPHPEAGLPEGYNVPGATASMDQAGQAFFQQTVHGDALASGNYRNLLDRNTQALRGAAPGGDPGDALNYVRSVEDARQQAVGLRIQQAQADADLAQIAASRGTSGQALMVGGPGKAQLFDYGGEVVNQLAAARDDAKGMADAAWDAARQDGFTSATTDTRPLYNAIEGLAQSSIKNLQAPGIFPYRELAPLYQDGDLRGMFDAMGARKAGTTAAGAGNGPNAVLQGPASLDTLHSLESSLGAAARQEQDAIRSGSGSGSPLRLRNLSAVRNVVTQTIEQGAQLSGNYAGMRNAMNATAAYYNTFGHGVIGDLLGSADHGDAPRKLASWLGNSTKAQAASQDFTTAMAHVGGAPGLNNALADYLRQDYLLVRGEGGPLAGQKWADNHAGFLQGASGPGATDPFSRLRSDVERLNQSDAAIPQLRDAAARDQDRVDVRMAQNFLGANEGQELEAALRGQAPAVGMQRLVDMTKQDGTGQAFRGLQRMLFDRTLAAGQKYGPDGGTYYSGRAAQAFMQANRGAFGVMRRADPVVGGNLDQLVNGLAAEDAIRARPDVAGLPKSLATAAPIVGQSGVSKAIGVALPYAGRLIGADLGRKADTGTIQIPGIGAEIGGKAAEGIYQMVTGREAPHIAAMNNLRNAMFDPALTQQYLSEQRAAMAQAGGEAGMGFAESPLRGRAAGHRAGVQATAVLGRGMTPLGAPPLTLSPQHPWVRAAGVEAAHSVLNADETTPPVQHRYPAVQGRGRGPGRTPWDR